MECHAGILAYHFSKHANDFQWNSILKTEGREFNPLNRHQ